VQLGRLQQDAAAAADGDAAAAGTATQLAAASQEARTLTLLNANLADDLTQARAQLEEACAAKEGAAARLDGVGKFLLKCMEDVHEKVVEVADEGGGAAGNGDAAVTVLPGAPLQTCTTPDTNTNNVLS
jgi:hypothetical protein